MEYIAYLRKDKGPAKGSRNGSRKAAGRESDYGVSFPDFPGCITAGRTLEEAREFAVEALTLHIAGMVEDGEPLPEPSTLDQLAKDPAMRGAVAFLVDADAPERTVRVNITARESQIEAIDRLARKAGMTRSAYMVHSSVRGVELERRAVGRR
jgi:predicted RNase H-like HicB family nuclease